MSHDREWEFAEAVADGESFRINGVDVWQQKWTDTGERVRVQDPHYHQDFTFCVYEFAGANDVVTFAAGELSNCIWGFYVSKPGRELQPASG